MSRRIPRARKLVYTILPALVAGALLEVGLRFVRFTPFPPLNQAHFQVIDGRSVEIPYGVDPLVGWRPIPGTRLVNRLGFRGPEIPVEKPAGVRRIVALGDSCTIIGQRPYIERMIGILEAVAGPGRYDFVNAGVGGYSSHQGLRTLESRVVGLAPDAVIAYFGWNDHWISANGLADRDQVYTVSASLEWALPVFRLRTAELLLYLWQTPRRQGAPAWRVPPSEYEANLRAIVAGTRTAGGKPVLVAAPSAFDVRDSAWVVRFGLLPPEIDVREVHALYLGIARKVAAETGAALVDLESLLAGTDKRQIFFPDGIHSTEFGLQRIAELLIAGMGDEDILPGEEARKAGLLEQTEAYQFGLLQEFEGELAYPSAEAQIARLERSWPDDPRIAAARERVKEAKARFNCPNDSIPFSIDCPR